MKEYQDYIVINLESNTSVSKIHSLLREMFPDSRIIVNDEPVQDYEVPTQFLVLTDTKSVDSLKIELLLTDYSCDIS